MGRFIVLVWVLSALAGAAGGADEAPDIDRLIEKVDRLYRSETSYAELEMQVVTPNWDRTLRMRMWTGGMDLYCDSVAQEGCRDCHAAQRNGDVELFPED